MFIQRVLITALLPLVAGISFYPVSTDVNTAPLCHDTYKARDFSRKSKVDVKSYLAINRMCPVQLPKIGERKMAFTLNPFRSDSMTIADGIIYTRYMISSGLLMARIGVTRGVGTIRNMVFLAVDAGAEKYRSASTKARQLTSEPFTFADHITPKAVELSNGIALLISVFIAIAILALQFHQRTLAKLLKEDKATVSMVGSDLKKNMNVATREELEGQLSEHSTTVNGSGEDVEIPSVTEEQAENISNQKTSGPGEASSEGSESSSTFLETPPPTPPRYMVDVQRKKASKTARDDMTVLSAGPKRKRRFGFKLRRKNIKSSDMTV